MFDNSPEDLRSGVLLGFFEGEHATEASLMEAGARRALALNCFAKYFGERALYPVEYVEQDWTAEEFSRGCYGGRMGTGVWTRYAQALSEPVEPDPLGRHRNGRRLERLHGRRRALGRTRRRGGAHRAGRDDSGESDQDAEVRLIQTHRSVPRHVVVLLAFEHVIAVLGGVSLQRGRKQIVDVLVGHLEAPARAFVKLDGDRLRSPVQVHVPAVRMTFDAFVMRDVQLRHGVVTSIEAPASRGVIRNGRCGQNGSTQLGEPMELLDPPDASFAIVTP